MIFGSGALADSKAVAWPLTKRRNFYAAQRILCPQHNMCERNEWAIWWPEKLFVWTFLNRTAFRRLSINFLYKINQLMNVRTLKATLYYLELYKFVQLMVRLNFLVLYVNEIPKQLCLKRGY